MRRKSIYRRNQRGVALLFALGVLSLLLVMGLAFVANSLLAQKVASNNSSRSQAKMLAQSAISRVAMSVMYYRYNASNPPPGASYSGFIPENYMDVHSYYNLPIKPEAAEPNHTDDAAKDGLDGADSKLIPGIWLTDYDLASDLRGEWSYITAKDVDNEDKLVGRIAYQVIPSTAQINLEHNLRGVYPQGTPARIPWDVRIGEDINELNLNETSVLTGWKTTHAPAPEHEDDMHASTFDAFFQAYAGTDSIFSTDKDVKEAWLRRWFIDGTVAADPEYYVYSSTSGTKYYHRFNLGKLVNDEGETITDEWYDRLVGKDAKITATEYNTEETVNALAYGGENSAEFKITDRTTPREVDRKVGLPFLKLIGSSAGSFEKIEFRRKQIAANLNDYCDSDSIPTSDEDAKSWQSNLSNDAAWPKYTGNEKTPYINEFAFGFRVHPSVESPNSPSMKIKPEVTAEIVAELISIYEKTPAEAYNLYMGLPPEQFTFTLDLDAKIKVKPEGGTETTVNPKGSITFTLASGASDSPREFLFAKELWKEGYALSHVELSLEATGSTEDAVGGALDCSAKISSALGDKPGTAELTGVSFKISKFTFQPKGLVLTRSDGTGVDFVRWKDSVTAPEKELFTNDVNYKSGSPKVEGDGNITMDEKSQKIFLAGMQVRDPRQNLNVTSIAADEDENKSDWRKFDEINWVEYDSHKAAEDNPYDDGVLSMKVDFAATSLAAAFSDAAGLVNGVSNPSDKEEEGSVIVGDYETVTDPAWRTESGHETGDPKTEQHLSTAYIRNAPMRSPWELGVIHRAMAWQTLNLKSAMCTVSFSADDVTEKVPEEEEIKPIINEDMNPDLSWEETTGTFFANGDGGLLEQIKMTDNAYCYGKLNVNMLSDNKDTEKDDEMARALFFNIHRGQSVGDLFVDDSGSYPKNGTQISWSDTSTVADPMKKAVDEFRAKYGAGYEHAFENRAQFLAWNMDPTAGYQPCLANGFGIISNADYEKLPDAQREEIVGKTINLLKGTNSVSNMIRFVVVAQTIRDMGGPSNTEIEIARIKYDGKVETKECKYGVFDVKKDDSEFPAGFPENDKYLYFDEITGEVKLLVTMENNPTTGQIIVRQIEYLE